MTDRDRENIKDPSNAPSLPERNIHWDFAKGMAYGDYLHLDKLLGAQISVSQSHDELLFITVHQSAELWLKLTLHEIKAAQKMIRQDALRPAFKMLARVGRIQTQLSQTWDVLSTLTPADYETFRDDLGQASGLQSFQYRELEFVLGAKDQSYLAIFRHQPTLHRHLKECLDAPSLYDEVLRLLTRNGLDVAETHLQRNLSVSYTADDSVLAAWRQVYGNTEKYWELYELAEKLIDLEDAFQTWRFRHATTVERIIGEKSGTGGSSGVRYLKQRLQYRLFPELWQVRTEI